MATNGHSGYPLKWFKDQDSARSSFECAICLEILKDPVQVRDCGHQFCELCIEDILKSDPRCPSCRIAISHEMIFKDHAANRLIGKLEVNCSNEGCSWIGELNSLVKDHVSSCTFLITYGGNNDQNLKNIEEKFEMRLIQEITKLRKKHEKDMEELKTKHEKDMEGLKTKHEHDIRELKFKHENDLIQIRTQHQRSTQAFAEDINHLRLISKNTRIYTMKISDFTKKLSEAKRTRTGGEVLSPPFFSSEYGYKLRLLVYLNEQPQGFTGYMGVFIAVMKTDHDGVLSWPFKKTCTFTVVDQQDDERQRQNHSMVLVPQGELQFKRPQQDENSGLGYPDFILHTKLKTRCFIRDNTVYVRVLAEGMTEGIRFIFYANLSCFFVFKYCDISVKVAMGELGPQF